MREAIRMMTERAVFTARDKGIPDRAVGMTKDDFLATKPRLSEFWTPLVVLDDSALRANQETMSAWCRAHDLELMPHGKTTMAPVLWQRQLDAGCLGITFATMGQIRTARSLGFSSFMLANSAVDPRSLAWLAGELSDPELRFVCWADSVDTVAAMERGLRAAEAPRPVSVCVELGAEGGRTGARTVAAAVEVACRIAASDVLQLAGVAGYEGSLGHDRSPHTQAAVRAYIAAQIELHQRISGLYSADEVFVTAGGSAYFDLVAEGYAGARDGRTKFVLRSGAYQVHDDGFYRRISPLDEGSADASNAKEAGSGRRRLQTAMRGIARVVSQPEPGLALLDAGRRDFPYDNGLPIPRQVATDLGEPWDQLAGEISALNDQHAYLLANPAPPVGAVVAVGLSHPCTAFDKWRVLPVVESWDSDVVVDLVQTYF